MAYADLEKRRLTHQKWRERHREKYQIINRKRVKEYNADLRVRVIAGYGGCCACCGEMNPAFLTLDHVNNDGAKERKLYGHSNIRTYRQALKENFPPRYQILCFNCNMGRAFRGNGICPHKFVVT